MTDEEDADTGRCNTSSSSSDTLAVCRGAGKALCNTCKIIQRKSSDYLRSKCSRHNGYSLVDVDGRMNKTQRAMAVA